MLEPYEWKRSRTVLRRERVSNRLDLVDYDDIVKNLGGDWINLGGSNKGNINPLEIKPISLQGKKRKSNEENENIEDESYIDLEEDDE